MQVQSQPNKVIGSRSTSRRTGWFRRLLTDVFFVAKRDRTWWMLPLVLLILLLGGLLAFVTMAGPLAPFIYPLL
jgi:hypothetical protein